MPQTRSYTLFACERTRCACNEAMQCVTEASNCSNSNASRTARPLSDWKSTGA